MMKLTHFSTHTQNIMVFANEALKCQSVGCHEVGYKLANIILTYRVNHKIYADKLSWHAITQNTPA